jgi:hypothetical protein
MLGSEYPFDFSTFPGRDPSSIPFTIDDKLAVTVGHIAPKTS